MEALELLPPVPGRPRAPFWSRDVRSRDPRLVSKDLATCSTPAPKIVGGGQRKKEDKTDKTDKTSKSSESDKLETWACRDFEVSTCSIQHGDLRCLGCPCERLNVWV